MSNKDRKQKRRPRRSKTSAKGKHKGRKANRSRRNALKRAASREQQQQRKTLAKQKEQKKRPRPDKSWYSSASKDRVSVYSKHLWKAIVALATIITLFFAVLAGYKFLASTKPLDVSVAWYHVDGKKISLVSPNDVQIEITVEDIDNQEIRIPVNLALRNNEDTPLEVVKVELSYSDELQVTSEAGRKIPERPGVLIYEHEFKTLRGVENFTPISKIDTLHIPFKYLFVPTVVISKDGLPDFWIMGLNYGKGTMFGDIRAEILVKIWCKKRPISEGKITLNVRPGVQFLYPPDRNSQVVPASDLDVDIFLTLSKERGESIDHWEDNHPLSGDLVGYYKIETEDMQYQLVVSNGISRRLIIDNDKDNFIDYELWDTKGDGKPDKRIVWKGKMRMVDWPREAMKE